VYQLRCIFEGCDFSFKGVNWGVQAYLKNVLAAANCVREGRGPLSHGRVAVRCLAGLLTSLPHFNYTSDLLQVGAFIFRLRA
jgi:hypothetical protein